VYGGLLYDLDADKMKQEAAAYQSQGAQVIAALPADAKRGGTWGYLRGTANETLSVQRQLNENKITSVLYNAARGNKESFKSLDGKKTGIIHLATHGFFIDDIEKNYGNREMLQRAGGGQKAFENPLLRSGLILAGGNNAWNGTPVEGIENGILFADDIARMNLLGAELVVLSACVTGLGDVKNSEGVFGLQRAFKLAGAETLIMSLWEVDDEGTSILINEFYRSWLSGKSKQEAFKEAQRKLRSDTRYASPYYWAAFVMMD
jgi:CHAT domain-containing protein